MFKLHFDIPPLPQRIDLHDEMLMLGSCFVDSIGNQLQAHKFNVSVNPIGTLFNPISIFDGFNIALGKRPLRPLAKRNDMYFSWDTHSRWSGTNPEQVQTALSEQFKGIAKTAKNAKWIMVTLGTAYVYEHSTTGEVVANCHKFPQQDFNKRLLTTNEIIAAFEATYTHVQAVNPQIKWLFTVSPVRHIKDGLVENNQSKAALIQAVAALVQHNQNCHYFPAYEIMIDELRDYRFYKSDMIHPNEQAVNYIWEAFQKTCLNDHSANFCKDWNKLLTAVNHQPLHVESQEHQSFLKATKRKLKELENMVDITAELEIIDAQIRE